MLATLHFCLDLVCLGIMRITTYLTMRLFVKKMKCLFICLLCILWARFFHMSELCLARKRYCGVGQGPPRFKANTSCIGTLGCCTPPLTYLMLKPQQAMSNNLASLLYFYYLLVCLTGGRN